MIILTTGNCIISHGVQIKCKWIHFNNILNIIIKNKIALLYRFHLFYVAKRFLVYFDTFKYPLASKLLKTIKHNKTIPYSVYYNNPPKYGKSINLNSDWFKFNYNVSKVMNTNYIQIYLTILLYFRGIVDIRSKFIVSILWMFLNNSLALTEFCSMQK